jgi:tetratricopeptide (TPR) repeat protein
MTTVRELHDKAMRLSYLALVARETGDIKRAEELAREALGYEEKAAALVPDEKASEPTRSILYRSAASLAYQCKEFQLAQQLIARGLAGFPPPKVEGELKALYDQVNFEQFLQSRGVSLGATDFQLAMKGNAIGFGSILYNEFIKRADSAFSLVDRTVQRKMGRMYQAVGRVAQMFRPFTRVISAMEPGSFMVKLQLGTVEAQQLSYLVDGTEIIQEIATGIQ